MRGGIGGGPIAAGAIGGFGDTEAPPGLADRLDVAAVHRPGADPDTAVAEEGARVARARPGEGAEATGENRTGRP